MDRHLLRAGGRRFGLLSATVLVLAVALVSACSDADEAATPTATAAAASTAAPTATPPAATATSASPIAGADCVDDIDTHAAGVLGNPVPFIDSLPDLDGDGQE